MNQEAFDKIYNISEKSEKVLKNYIEGMEIFEVEKKMLLDMMITIIKNERIDAAIAFNEYEML